MSRVDRSRATRARRWRWTLRAVGDTRPTPRRLTPSRAFGRSRRAPTLPGPTTQAATSGPARRGRLPEAPKGRRHLPLNAGPTKGAGRPSEATRHGCPTGKSVLPGNPDAEEPEAPIAEVRIVDWSHPAALVVEQLVVVAALVDAAPSEVRRRLAATPTPAVCVATPTPPRSRRRRSGPRALHCHHFLSPRADAVTNPTAARYGANPCAKFSWF